MTVLDCRPSIISSGDQYIAWIAEHLREPWLNPVMIKLSHLGEMGPILLVLSLAYWFWNKRHAKFLCYGMFAALLINLWLKGWVMECRPNEHYWLTPVSKVSYSFPSGHAQVSILIWVGLAYYLRSKWLSPFLVFVGIVVSLSRPYLGVHYVHDVVAGMLIGLSILIICIECDEKSINLFRRLPLWGASLVLLGFLTLFNLIIHNPQGLKIAGTASCFGFWLGCQWEDRYLKYVPSRRPVVILGQLVIGIIGILLLRFALPHNKVGYLQYGLLGFWIAFGAPWVFEKACVYLNFKQKNRSS